MSGTSECNHRALEHRSYTHLTGRPQPGAKYITMLLALARTTNRLDALTARATVNRCSGLNIFSSVCHVGVTSRTGSSYTRPTWLSVSHRIHPSYHHTIPHLLTPSTRTENDSNCRTAQTSPARMQKSIDQTKGLTTSPAASGSFHSQRMPTPSLQPQQQARLHYNTHKATSSCKFSNVLSRRSSSAKLLQGCLKPGELCLGLKRACGTAAPSLLRTALTSIVSDRQHFRTFDSQSSLSRTRKSQNLSHLPGVVMLFSTSRILLFTAGFTAMAKQQDPTKPEPDIRDHRNFDVNENPSQYVAQFQKLLGLFQK